LKDEHPVTGLCDLYQVSRSGYYAWKRRLPCRSATDDEMLIAKIEAIYMESGRSYGSLRLKAELNANGVAIGRRRVMRLMVQQGLRGRRRRRRQETPIE
jgi:putative transposase